MSDFKLKTMLKDFQVDTLDWMIKHEQKYDGGMLCNEPGLGKTLNLLALISKNPVKTLIVCPSGIVNNWINEIEKHTTLHKLHYVKYYGPKRQKIPILNDTLIYITSYSIIAREFDNNSFENDSLFGKIKFDRIILDEGHYIRNSKTKMCKSILFLSELHTKVIKKWVVTATPVYNNVNDTFNYFKFIGLEGIDNKKDWTKNVTKKLDGLYKLNGWMEKHSICFKKNIVLKELKDKIEETIILKFNTTEYEFYEALKTYSYSRMNKLMKSIKQLKHLKDKDMVHILHGHVLVYILRLRQACNSPWLIIKNMKRLNNCNNLEESTNCLQQSFYDKNIKQLDEDCPICFDTIGDYITQCGHKFCHTCITKIERLNFPCPICRKYIDFTNINNTKSQSQSQSINIDINNIHDTVKIQKVIFLTKQAINNNKKIVIVSQWVGFLDIIRTVFEKELPDIKYVNLQGNINMKNRTENIKNFENNKTIKVCFLSLCSSSEGINLVSASSIVFCDSWWNQSKMIQAQDRLHRITQNKQVYVYNLQVENSIEENITLLIKKKTKMSNLITQKWNIKDIKNYNDTWITEIIKLLEPVQLPQDLSLQDLSPHDLSLHDLSLYDLSP